MVMVNRRPEGIDVPSITPDDATGIRLAVEHLASLGHRRIAHLAGPENTSTGVARARAFRAAVRDLGLDDDPALVRRPATSGARTPAQRGCGSCSTAARSSPRSSPATT